MRVLMYCEGVMDFEPICIFIRKTTLLSKITITRKTRQELRRETTLLNGRRGIHKHVTDIDRLAMVAQKTKYLHIAYHQDADGNDTNVYGSIENKFSNYSDKFSCLAIVPKETIESWLLADEHAYIAIFGSKPTHLPKKPEDVWGEKKDPASNYPKHVIKRVLMQYHKTPNRDVYAEIAEQCNIDTLRIRCPISFDRFFTDLHKFV